MAWRNPLAPPRPAGMSDEEARLAAILPPVGHTVPPATVAEQVRGFARVLRFSARFLLRMRALEDIALGSPAFREESSAFLRTLGIQVEIRGETHLQRDGQVLMWNQTSHLDHLVLGVAIPVAFRSLYNVELAKVPRYGPWLRKQGHFFVDRFDEAQWRASIAEAAAWIREGNTVLVSPEGTRSWDGRLLPMKRGAFLLAVAAQRPIVPVVVRGAQPLLPRGRFTVKPGIIAVEFLEPIPTEGYTEETRTALEAHVAERFREALQDGPPVVPRRVTR